MCEIFSVALSSDYPTCYIVHFMSFGAVISRVYCGLLSSLYYIPNFYMLIGYDGTIQSESLS